MYFYSMEIILDKENELIFVPLDEDEFLIYMYDGYRYKVIEYKENPPSKKPKRFNLRRPHV